MGGQAGSAVTERVRRRPGRIGRGVQLPGIEQKPFRQPRLGFAPLKAVSDDALEAIHHASLTILEEIGIDFLNPEAKAIAKRAGADVKEDSERVRLDRGLVLEAISTCPPEFTLHARNPEHNLRFGGDWIAFAQMASAPNCADNDRGRRPGSQADFRELIKLGQFFNIIHLSGGYPVEPVDLHASIRHLECLRDFATLTDKVFHCYSLGRERNLDGVEIARIARGISEEQLDREPSILSIINSS
jgi:trimethylamine---corrinoid protein Co-methyltransferase